MAGLRPSGIVVSFVLDGPIDRDASQAYAGEFLGPELIPRDILMMDNLKSYNGSAVQAAIEDGGRVAAAPPALLAGL